MRCRRGSPWQRRGARGAAVGVERWSAVEFKEQTSWRTLGRRRDTAAEVHHRHHQFPRGASPQASLTAARARWPGQGVSLGRDPPLPVVFTVRQFSAPPIPLPSMASSLHRHSSLKIARLSCAGSTRLPPGKASSLLSCKVTGHLLSFLVIVRCTPWHTNNCFSSIHARLNTTTIIFGHYSICSRRLAGRIIIHIIC